MELLWNYLISWVVIFVETKPPRMCQSKLYIYRPWIMKYPYVWFRNIWPDDELVFKRNAIIHHHPPPNTLPPRQYLIAHLSFSTCSVCFPTWVVWLLWGLTAHQQLHVHVSGHLELCGLFVCLSRAKRPVDTKRLFWAITR